MPSVIHHVNQIPDMMTRRQMISLLQSMQADLAMLKAYVDTHQHAALNAAPSTPSSALKTNP